MNYSIIEEQGVTFAVVCVKESTILSTYNAQRTKAAFEAEFGMPVALWGNRNENIYARPDILRFLQSIHVSQIPWKRRAA